MKPIALVLLLQASINLGAAAGTSFAPWVKEASSPRASAMAGAGVAAGNPSSLALNPASICRATDLLVSYSHNEAYLGLRQENVEVVQPDLGFGDLALQVRSLYSSDIERLDTAGNPDGTMRYMSFAYGLAIAHSFGIPEASFGLQVKGIYTQYGQSDLYDSTAAVDLGMRYLISSPIFYPESLTLGLSITNYGMGIAYRNVKLEAPASLRGGFLWCPKDSPVAVVGDIDYALDEKLIIPRAGFEFTMFKVVSARGGYAFSPHNLQTADGASVGAGIYLSPWTIDYSYSPNWGNAGSHRIGVSAKLGSGFKQQASEKNSAQTPTKK